MREHLALQVCCLAEFQQVFQVFLFLLLAKHALWLIDEHVKGVLRPLGTPQQQRGIGGKGVPGPLPAIQLLPWLLVAGELVAIRALGEQSAHQV